MKIKLVFQIDRLGLAWKKYFKEEKNIEIIKNDITQISCDAIVSPANSFGFMDGGLDLALSKRFGWNIQEELQKQIKNSQLGELLIGQTITLKTNDDKIPFLISAPTMRVPMNFNIPTSINAYLAMKAILITVKNNPKIETVAIPGLATGCGKMDVKIAAKQMLVAYNEIIKDEKMNFMSFEEAQKYQIEINKKSLIWDY